MIYTDLFTGLLIWANASTENWNRLVGGSFILLIISLIVFFSGHYLFNGWNLFNSNDERVSKIFTSTAALMFVTLIICDLILPHAYMWQIFFLIKYSVVLLIGGSYMMWKYHRDLN